MGIRIFEIQQLVLYAVTGQLLGAPVKLHAITSTCRKLGNGSNENRSVLELICVLHFGYAWGTANSCTILIIWKVLRAWNCAVSCVNSQQLLQPNNEFPGLIRKRGRKRWPPECRICRAERRNGWDCGPKLSLSYYGHFLMDLIFIFSLVSQTLSQ